MGNVEDMLKMIQEMVETRKKMVELAEIMATKSPLEIARAWFTCQKGNYMITKQAYKNDEEHDEAKLKLIGLIEDGEDYKFEFETVLGDTIQLGGVLHRDFVLVGGSDDISAIESMDAVISVLQPDHSTGNITESPISHLLS